MRFSLLISALTLCTVVAATTGCATPVEPDVPRFTTCEDPRPQVCTMIFAPVCGTTVTGALATHASGCNACADDQVVSYVDGACEEEGDSL